MPRLVPEIVDNIKAICTSPKGDMELPGGVVITGGGSALNGLAELLHRVIDVHVERISSLVVQDRANEFYILTPAWHVVAWASTLLPLVTSPKS